MMEENVKKNIVEFYKNLGLVTKETQEHFTRIIEASPYKPVDSPLSLSAILSAYISFLAVNENDIGFISSSLSSKYLNNLRNSTISTAGMSCANVNNSQNNLNATLKKRKKLLEKIIKKKNKKAETFDYIIKKRIFFYWRRNFGIFSSFASSCRGGLNSFCFETSQTRKELEELKECTFRPVINAPLKKNSNNISSLGSSVYERLYTDYIKLNIMKEIKRNETEKQISEEATFSPKLIRNKKYNLKISKSFSKRMNEFTSNRDSKKELLAKNLEKKRKEECTFSPTLNVNRHRKARKKIERENLPSSNTNKNSNTNLTNTNTSPNKEPDSSKTTPKQVVDISRIESLYNAYKLKKKKLMNIQTEIDKEEGITFKPYIINDLKFNDGMNYIERNEKFLENKKYFIEKANENHFNYQKPKRQYSTREKSIITNKIIERLYKTGVEKQLLRNERKDDE